MNNGLHAAALMPKAIVDGQTVPVRLFIRKVSDKEVWMTVSDRPGYDDATATDEKGLLLKSARPLIYPQGYAGGIPPN